MKWTSHRKVIEGHVRKHVALALFLFSSIAFAQLNLRDPAFIAGTASSGFPPNIANLVLWLDASDITAANGSTISNWVDKSGWSHNFTNLASSSPFLTNNVLNGKPALRFTGFSGNGSRLRSATNFMTGFKTGEIFAVIRSTATPSGANDYELWQFGNTGAGGGSAAHPFTDSRLYENFGVSNSVNFPITNITFPTNWHVWNVLESATNLMQMRYNGNLVSGYDWVPTAGYTNNMWLGSANALTAFWNGEMAEVLMYNIALSDVARASVGTYLSNKYSIQMTNSDTIYMPTNMPGIAGWWRASNTSSNDGDTIQALLDESPHARYWTQNTSGFRPVLKKNIVNGQSILRFDGTDDSMSLTTPGTIVIPTAFTVIAVHQPTGDQRLLLGYSGNNFQWRTREPTAVNNCLFFQGAGSSASGTFPQPVTPFKMTVFRRLANGEMLYWCNAVASAGIANGGSVTVDQLGTTLSLTAWGQSYKGDLAEIAVFTNALPEDAIAKLYYTYYRGRYGLP